MTTSPYRPSQVQPLASDEVTNEAGLLAAVAARGHDHDLDVIKRDRFELLSAYLDGEVTPGERQYVLSWLKDDPSARCLYNRLLTLRQGLRTQACPLNTEVESTLTGVFHSVNRRLRLVTMATAGVVAMGIIQILSGEVGGGYGPWRSALVAQPEVLQIALDKPAFPIPADAVSPVEVGYPEGQQSLPIDSDL
jgi:anti-sigma factor RsiW